MLLALPLVGCSFVFSSESQEAVDAGAGIADAPIEDLLCTPGTCPSLTIVHDIGLNSQNSDFGTPHDWVAARHGNLVSRIVLAVEAGALAFAGGELVRGAMSDCTGTLVDSGRAPQNRLSLDTPMSTCIPGETLRGETTGAEAELLGYLSEGVIERGEMQAGTYFNEKSLVFHDEEGVTDNQHYMWLTGAPGAQHLGNQGEGAVIDGSMLIGGEFDVIRVDLPFTRFEWFEVAHAPGAKTLLQVQAAGFFAQHMIYRGGESNGLVVSDVGGARSPEAWIANSIFYDFGRWAVTALGSSAVVHLANTTTYACAKVENNPSDDGCVGAKDGGELEVVNSAALAALPLASVGGDFFVQDGIGAILGTSSNNASSDMSAPGAQSVELLLDSELSVADPVSPNLRPSTNSRLLGAGTPIQVGWPFDISRDLSGNLRSEPWNIGAF